MRWNQSQLGQKKSLKLFFSEMVKIDQHLLLFASFPNKQTFGENFWAFEGSDERGAASRSKEISQMLFVFNRFWLRFEARELRGTSFETLDPKVFWFV